VTTKC